MNADVLRIELSGAEVHHLAAVGTAPGVAAVLPAARNGPGQAWLRSTGAGNTLAWKAPGSASYGPDVLCETDGDYVLLDGEDADKFCRVRIWSDWLNRVGDFPVWLREIYNNPVAFDDVTAAEAATGLVDVYSLTVRNAGVEPLLNVRIWLDPAGDPNTALSLNGSEWSQPVDEPSGLLVGTLVAPATSRTIYLRRTVPPAAAGTPRRLVHFHVGFDSVL